MPKIKFTGVYDDKLGSQDAKRIEGTRIDNGEEWSKKFFANNRKLRTELDDFGVGDNVDVKMEKSGKFWNIAGFGEVSSDLAERIANTGSSEYKNPRGAGSTGGGSSSTTTSSGLTKAEWAEKDRLTQIRIAKAVALKAVVDNTKVGTSTESLIKTAEGLMDWLLDEKKWTDEQEGDPLDPPVG